MRKMWYLHGKKKTWRKFNIKKIKQQIIQLINARSVHLEELTSLLYHFESSIVVQAVNELTDDGKIKIDLKQIISKQNTNE